MILCYSGTGNSRYIAQRIADELQDNIIDLNEKIKTNNYSSIETGDDVILVVPTYAWRIPKIVSNWLYKTKFIGAKRIWFVMNCGSEIGNATKYNLMLANDKHLDYMGTKQILMPENYIAMFNAPQLEEAKEIVEKAEINIKEIITMSVKTVPWLPDGTLTNPERNTISAKTEKQLQENTRSRELTITLTRMVLSPTPD